MSRPKPQSKRLLIFFYDLSIGGIQRILVDIVEYLQSQNKKEHNQVTLYLKSYSGSRHNQDYIKRIQKAGARIIYRPRWTIGPFRIGTLSHMIWIIFKVHPDVILTHLRLLSVVTVVLNRLFWWRNTTVVLNEGILTSEHLRNEVPKWRRSYWRLLMKWAYSRADRVIVPTLAVKQNLMDEFDVPSQNICIAVNWTMLHKVASSIQKKNDRIYDLIYIGRLEKQKNISDLIDIVKMLTGYRQNLKVCIVGTGSMEHQLRADVRGKKLRRTIHFVGIKKDVSSYLERSKIFVLTSEYEGMPIVLLEAKALGIPAVISDFEGAREVVDNGKDGYICQTKEEFIERINTLVKDGSLRKRLGRHAIMRAEREFGVAALQKFCRMLMETKKKRINTRNKFFL